MNEFGCDNCYPAQDPVSWHAHMDGLTFVEAIDDDDRFLLRFFRCSACDCAFAHIRTEFVDWKDGNDSSYDTLVPLTDIEAEHLVSAEPGRELYEWLGDRGENRRHLVNDYPSSGPIRFGWRTGSFIVALGW